MATLSPYQILGVSKSATPEEIKNAYRELAKKYHPDLNPGNKEAERRFKDVSAAYELIGTPEQKARFDRGEFSETQRQGPGEQRGPFYSQTQGDVGGRYTSASNVVFEEGWGDIFESLFRGQHKQRAGPRKGAEYSEVGPDENYSLEIDLRDAVIGAEKDVSLPSGERVRVKIPPGISTGTKLRFPGLGRPGRGGGSRGDVYVEVKIRPSQVFRIQGDDLILELPVTLSEAVLGAQVKVPTLDNQVLLTIPSHVNTDTKLRLAGQGLFNRKTGKRGDQIIILKVYLPPTINSELEDAIRASSERHPYNPRVKFAA